MFKNLQMLNKECQAETKVDSEQMLGLNPSAKMEQNPVLAAVSIEVIIEYCRNNLNSQQKKQIMKAKKNIIQVEKNIIKVEKYYLFEVSGDLISEFKRIKDIAEYLKTPLQTVVAAYKRRNIIYGIYWVSKSPNFDCDKSYYSKRVILSNGS